MSGICVGVVGSRDYADYKEFKSFVKSKCNGILIDSYVSGGARGADTMAEWLAEEQGIPITVHEAEWAKHGRSAGMIRNQYIVDDCDLLIAFLAPDSRGTRDTIRRAKGAEVPMYVKLVVGD